MKFMNEMDIAEAARRHRGHPVLGPATRFLAEFKDQVNAHSDGWPYWSPPAKAAAKLMDLVDTNPWDEPKPVTEADLRRALAPIKSFMTRRGLAAGMVMPPLPGDN